ncbi:unnamed protein product [Nesidiocoris tenuis]|uniref:Uncharacterized protein n=1 Tax=Nesidiocoris tenuis TaxID=355587 RepID=A0A6H5G6X5_9HEMI|nr:unnamed protein product [Nesidiocoris tenuis]
MPTISKNRWRSVTRLSGKACSAPAVRRFILSVLTSRIADDQRVQPFGELPRGNPYETLHSDLTLLNPKEVQTKLTRNLIKLNWPVGEVAPCVPCRPQEAGRQVALVSRQYRPNTVQPTHCHNSLNNRRQSTKKSEILIYDHPRGHTRIRTELSKYESEKQKSKNPKRFQEIGKNQNLIKLA